MVIDKVNKQHLKDVTNLWLKVIDKVNRKNLKSIKNFFTEGGWKFYFNTFVKSVL